jgi:cellulose synthase/poly-beta-1,6-N-acetylglucosamine synthase-like glycosyltransferase
MLLVTLYFAALAGLTIFGLHRLQLLYLYWRARHSAPLPQPGSRAAAPRVLLQLPIYNERHVARRVVMAVAKLQYPRERLRIQVLDDSTDATRLVLQRLVRRLARLGIAIELKQRDHRTGFKAGALAEGLSASDEEFCAIFDADFVPPRDFLTRALPHFAAADVGMVQARWGHLNRDYSLLTRLQSIFLDGHFGIEHVARHRSGRCFNFNGTAGIWRRRCIEAAGGWQADTLTEDLDLSYRAQLAGWRFVYLDELRSDAELPIDMNAFKAQQHRWAKGSVQTARKLLPRILCSSLPWRVKLEACFHLTNNLCYLLMTIPILLWVPTLQTRYDQERPWMLAVAACMAMTTACVASYHLVGQRGRAPLRRTLVELPPLLALGIGLSLNNGRAVLEGLFGHRSNFVRTPKHGAIGRARPRPQPAYRLRPSAWALLELAVAAYFAAGLTLAVAQARWIAIPFLLLFLFGFTYVGLASFGRAPERLFAFGSLSACLSLAAFLLWISQAYVWRWLERVAT